MDWLNTTALLLFIIVNIAAYTVGKMSEAMSEKLVRALSLILLCGNLLRYVVIYPLFYHVIKIPAEFSTLAYFIAPLILLSRWEKINCWAAYSSLMAGFFYYMTMIVAGETIYGASSRTDTAISLLCHGTLYFCGFVTITKKQYDPCDVWKLLVGIGYVIIRAKMLRPIVADGNGMLIYLLLDAVPIKRFLPEETWKAVVPIYYSAVILFLLVTALCFFHISERQYKKFSHLRNSEKKA